MGVCQGPDLLGSLMSSLYSSDPRLLPWSVGLMTAAQEGGMNMFWKMKISPNIRNCDSCPSHLFYRREVPLWSVEGASQTPRDGSFSIQRGQAAARHTSGAEASDPCWHESWFCRQVALAVKCWEFLENTCPPGRPQPLIFHRGPQWLEGPGDAWQPHSSSARGPGAALAHWWASHPLDGGSCLSHVASVLTWNVGGEETPSFQAAWRHLLHPCLQTYLFPTLRALCMPNRCFAHAVFIGKAFFFPFFSIKGPETAVQLTTCYYGHKLWTMNTFPLQITASFRAVLRHHHPLLGAPSLASSFAKSFPRRMPEKVKLKMHLWTKFCSLL